MDFHHAQASHTSAASSRLSNGTAVQVNPTPSQVNIATEVGVPSNAVDTFLKERGGRLPKCLHYRLAERRTAGRNGSLGTPELRQATTNGDPCSAASCPALRQTIACRSSALTPATQGTDSVPEVEPLPERDWRFRARDNQQLQLSPAGKTAEYLPPVNAASHPPPA